MMNTRPPSFPPSVDFFGNCTHCYARVESSGGCQRCWSRYYSEAYSTTLEIPEREDRRFDDPLQLVPMRPDWLVKRYSQ